MSPEPVAARLGSYSHLDTLRSDSGPSTELSLPSRLIRESVWYLAALPVVAAIAEALPVCYAWDTVDGVVIPLGDVDTASVTDLHNHLQGCWGSPEPELGRWWKTAQVTVYALTSRVGTVPKGRRNSQVFQAHADSRSGDPRRQHGQQRPCVARRQTQHAARGDSTTDTTTPPLSEGRRCCHMLPIIAWPQLRCTALASTASAASTPAMYSPA